MSSAATTVANTGKDGIRVPETSSGNLLENPVESAEERADLASVNFFDPTPLEQFTALDDSYAASPPVSDSELMEAFYGHIREGRSLQDIIEDLGLEVERAEVKKQLNQLKAALLSPEGSMSSNQSRLSDKYLNVAAGGFERNLRTCELALACRTAKIAEEAFPKVEESIKEIVDFNSAYNELRKVGGELSDLKLNIFRDLDYHPNPSIEVDQLKRFLCLSAIYEEELSIRNPGRRIRYQLLAGELSGEQLREQLALNKGEAAHRIMERLLDQKRDYGKGRLVPKESWHYIPTGISTFLKFISQLECSSEDVFLDAGCGAGMNAILTGFLTPMQVRGIDIEDLYINVARKSAALIGRPDMQFKNEDLFTADFSEATVIFAYTPFRDEGLQRKFIAKLKDEALRRAEEGGSAKPLRICTLYELTPLMMQETDWAGLVNYSQRFDALHDVGIFRTI